MPTVSYTENRKGQDTTQYCCSKRSCNATLTMSNVTGELVGENLPQHNHGSKIMKKVAKETEDKVVDRFASVPGTSASAVLQEISSNILASNFPGI